MKIDIEKLKLEVPAWKVIGTYVQLTKSKDGYKGLCPFHSESNPSFGVINKGDGWFYKCLACQEGGDVITFLEKIEKISKGKAIEMLTKMAGRKKWHEDSDDVSKHIREMSESSFDKKETPKIKLTMEAWSKFEKNFAENPAAIAWLEKTRGISFAVAKEARIGFCQNVRGRVDDEENRNKGWVMFPRVYGDEILTCKMRCIAAKDFSQISNMRQDTLFNAPTVSPFDPIYVTEGEPDALVLEQAGFRAVSLPMANAPVTKDMRLLLKEATHIFLAGDNDGGVGTDYMRKLKKEFKENTYLIMWPDVKDANDFFLKTCGGDINMFRVKVNKLSDHAKNNPVEGIYDAVTAMENADGTDPMDNPRRWRWRQPSLDRMAIIPPGGVIVIYSSYSGSGKSTLVYDPLIYQTRIFGERTLVYSAELSVDENICVMASHILQADRNKLSKEDYQRCANVLRNGANADGFKFYIGYNPDLHGHKQVLDFIEIAVRTFGITRVVLDHIHFIMSVDDEGNLAQAETEAMNRIKQMAVTYGLIFVVIAQSNKEGQSIKNLKTDEHGTIMGSVAFNTVPHAVYLLHRKILAIEDPLNPPKDRLSQESDIVLKKVRTCGPGNSFARLLFDGRKSTFNELSTKELPPTPDNF